MKDATTRDDKCCDQVTQVLQASNDEPAEATMEMLRPAITNAHMGYTVLQTNAGEPKGEGDAVTDDGECYDLRR